MKYLYTIIMTFVVQASLAQADFTYLWRQINGPATTTILHPTSDTTTVTGLDIPGEYLYEFSVTNMFGTGRDTVKITVLSGPPLALDTSKPVVIQRPEVKRFSAQAITKGNLIYVQVKSPARQKIRVLLVNMLGQTLAHADIIVKKGENIFTLPKPRAAGIYVLRFYNEITNQTYKIMI